jgi:nucleotide-binding universal stress UspA family protein
MFVSEEALHDYHQAEGISSLEEAGKILDEAHVAYSRHVLVGHISETIVRFAREKGFDEIVMGTHGRTGLTHLLLGSIASEIVKKSELPVTLVK